MRRAAKAKGPRIVPLVRIALICAVTYIGLFAMLLFGVTPEQYDIKVGTPAPTQIKATKDIQDTVTTEALRAAAANAVEPSYKSADPTVVESVLEDLNAHFDNLRAVHDAYTADSVRNLTGDQLAEINTLTVIPLSRDQLNTLIETSDDTLDSIFKFAASSVQQTLDSTLPEGQESSAIKNIRTQLNQRYSAQLTAIVIDAVRTCLKPNMLIDEAITEEIRQNAREDVQTVWYVKDQVIVGEGEIVTEAQYTMIAALGILDENTFDVRMFLGIAMLIALVFAATGFYLSQYNREILESSKQISLLCLIVLLVVGLSLAFRTLHSYLMPVSLGLLLVVILMDARLALFVNLMLTLLISILAPAGSSMFPLLLMSSVCGPMIVALFAYKSLRTTSLLAGVIIGAVNFATTLAVGLINSAEFYDVLLNAGIAAASGIVSAVLSIGLQPLLEAVFNLATSTKLIELSNPNQPLLRRLLLEASGTYHHSIIVANLAEAACSAVGANGLLARVGAYYHDIGKLKRPVYFKENQMGDNPHDRTDPRVSTAILTAHTRDGAQMAQKARIPEPVVNIIRQHHGDTPVMFFYDKAQKLYGDQVDIAAFRYEGPRPQSREAAIVMLADTIEAATRALPNPDPEKIDALIRKLVRGKLNDGQLDNSNLTFNELDKISSAFSTVLTGVFHERIEYPDVAIPARTDRPDPAPAADKPAADKPVEIPAAEPKPAEPAAAEPPKPVAAQTSAPAPAAPVQAAPTEQNRPVVSPGTPAPPVQAAPAEQIRPVVSPGAPVPPVQAAPAEQNRPVIAPGTPAPPVQAAPAEMSRPVENQQKGEPAND